jgi:uncharacterized protein (TIGR02466 family)
MTQSTLQPSYHFSSPVYFVNKPEYLDAARAVSLEYLDAIPAEVASSPVYPAQTTSLVNEPELAELTAFIAQSAWTILDAQGYDVKDRETYFLEMWCQEHAQYQGHDEHVHGNGSQISGFYFIDCPDDACRIMLHDPRPSKTITELPESDLNKITDASSKVLYIPKPGHMYFINSWMGHSITRNLTTSPTRLIHFNLAVRPAQPKQDAAVVL